MIARWGLLWVVLGTLLFVPIFGAEDWMVNVNRQLDSSEEGRQRIPFDVYKGNNDSLSVIITTKNDAVHVERTLVSVEHSLKTFMKQYPGSSEVRMEVIIVDDASTDNTVSRISNFVLGQKKSPVIWKLIALREPLRVGAARNFGVRESTGDVLYFLDGDDEYYPEHVPVCWNFLVKTEDIGMVQMVADIDLPEIHPEWITRITTMMPATKCMWRKLHLLVEGFPDQIVWTNLADIGYTMSFEMIGVNTGKTTQSSVKNNRQPGDFLDTIETRVKTEPDKNIFGVYEKEDNHKARMSMLYHHRLHLRRKVEMFLNGSKNIEDLPADPFWAIFDHTRMYHNIAHDFNILDANKLKLNRYFQFLTSVLDTGDVDQSNILAQSLHLGLYDSNIERPWTPLHYTLSSKSNPPPRSVRQLSKEILHLSPDLQYNIEN